MSSHTSEHLNDDTPELDDDHGTGLEDDSSDDSHDDDISSYENGGHENYAFTIENGAITAIFEVEHGVQQPESIEAGEEFIVDTNGDVLKIETKTWGQEITRYTDTDGDGLYAKLSEQWVSNTESPVPTPEIGGTLNFYGTSGDDTLGLNPSDVVSGGTGSDQFVFRKLGHVEIEDFDHGEGDRIVIDTGLGLESLAQVIQYVTGITYDGQNTIIEFGEMVSIKLAGISPSFVSESDFVVLS